MTEKIRVLVVDDSLVVRRIVMEEIAAQPDIDVVGEAATGRAALDKAKQLQPHVVILDIEMPEMDGITALTHLRQAHPHIHVIMFSSLTELGAAATLEALSKGAVDFFAKPKGAGGLDASRQLIRAELVPAIRAICAPKIKKTAVQQPTATTPLPSPAPSKNARVDIVAIGASTGGPNALAEIFKDLPAGLPVPVVIVQHMPPLFTQMLAERLTKISPINTVEAQAGDELRAGQAWVAPGDHHMVVMNAGQARIRINQDPPENACRPAVDPLLRSVASVYGPNCLCVVLTGMGQDGLRGCQSVRATGGQILAQDEASSVVWGMPGFVARAGLADKVLPLSMMSKEIVRRVRSGRE